MPKDKYPTIDKGYNKYGASMGRANWKGLPEDKSVRVFHLPIDHQGYDVEGAYWGIGEPLYCATDGISYREFTRATDRKNAIGILGIVESKLIRK